MHLGGLEVGARAVANLAALAEFGVGVLHSVPERRKIQVAGRAGRSRGRRRGQQALRVQNRILAGWQNGFRAVHVAHGAIGGIVNRARGTHRRVAHARKVVVAPAKPDHDVGLVEAGQVHARMDLVNQQSEVHALRRQRLVRRHGCTGPHRAVVLGRVVAQHAHLDLVAVGTVADMVPLTGENRILTRAGLERLGTSNKVGLRALMDIADVPDEVTPYHIGFRIGPRLNAAGRIGDAMAALELLLTEDRVRAAALAKFLNEHNAERQRIEEQMIREALAMARAEVDLERERVVVLAKEGWHVGVVGIVASRVLQEFYRPTVIIGIGDGMGKGSCRSIAGFSMVGALGECAPLLERFGGHEMAAGLSVKAEKIPALRKALNEIAARTLSDEDLTPQVMIDAEMRLAQLDDEFFDQLTKFDPCGMDNPAPLFMVRGVRLRGEPRVVGKGHLKFFVTDGEATTEAIWWGAGARELPAGEFDVAFTPELNKYKGAETVQMKVKDVRAAAEERARYR